MFVGHFAAAMAVKKATPMVSLGTLFLATQLIDLLWPMFLLFGIETVAIDPGNTAFTPLDFLHYPWSHSMLMVVFYGLLVGGIYYLIRKKPWSAVWLAVLVFSHWLLDLITHRPDLPLAPGAENIMMGFGLWNSVAATMIIELGFFVVGIYLYLSVTSARNITGVWSFWGLIGFLLIIYAANLISEPPPSAAAIAQVGFAQWLFVIWGYFIDHNRVSRINQRRVQNGVE